MAATTGLTGNVNSWTGTLTSAMVALIRPASFNLETNAAELDTTGFSSVVESALKGLRTWNGTIEGYLATPTNGLASNVSGAAYSVSPRSWELSIRSAPITAHAWPVASGNWGAFLPGLVSWSGSYEALVDDTTAVKFAGDATEPLTATFTISSGNTLAGSIFTTGASVVSRVGELQVVRYSFRGTGHVTSVGSGNVLPASSSLVTPVAGALTLQATNSRTYSGSAFWTEIMVRCGLEEVNNVRIGFQGTGALTGA
jgi:hypothetical protein